MALEDDPGTVFIPFGSRLGNHHIADFVGLAFKATGCRKLLKISDNLLLVTRFARDTGDLTEKIQNFFCIHH